jgi:competence protein ComEA
MLNGPRKNQLGIACIGGLALFGCCFIGAKHLRQPAPIVFETPTAAQPAPNSAAQTIGQAPMVDSQIVVHVAGAVKNPGVYHFAPGARVVDAVHAAGGPTSFANLDDINLAAKLVDGSQMRVPSKSVAAKTSPAKSVSSPISKQGSLPPVTIDPAYIPTSGDIYKSSDAAPTQQSSAPVASAHAWSKKSVGDANINTASLAELESLPGVGASTAQKIIDFRQQHGGFKTVDDLLGVPGIGPKKLEKMRSHVKL